MTSDPSRDVTAALGSIARSLVSRIDGRDRPIPEVTRQGSEAALVLAGLFAVELY